MLSKEERRMAKTICLVQLGVNNSIVFLGFNAQLPECFAADCAQITHLDQGTENKQLSIYLRLLVLAGLLILRRRVNSHLA